MTLSVFLENKIGCRQEELQVFSISDIIEEIGEEGFRGLISNFCCPHDKDIEFFLKSRSVPYEKSDFSRTYLVCFENERSLTVVAYFAIATKPFIVNRNCSNSFRKKIYGQFSNTEVITGALIGQISKNFYNGLDKTISGNDIIALALEKIVAVSRTIGIRIVFLECRDNEYLKKFYEELGFGLYKDANGVPIKNKDGLLCYIAKIDKFLPQN